MGSVIRCWQRFRGGAGNLAPAIRPHDLPNKTKLHANTAIGFGVGAEHVGPLIQPSNGAKLTPGAGFGAVIAFQSPSPINSVAFGKDATWPVWSGW